MGTIKQGILGDFSGKVGTVIGGTWKGIGYMRAMPTHVANPQTDAQLAQRDKVKVTMAFLQPLTQYIRTGWRQYAVKMTAMNAAFSYTIKNALQGTYPNYTIDYPNALVAKGNLPPALNAAVTSTVAGTILFSWDDNSTEEGASTFDKNQLVVYDPVKNQAVTFNGLAERADGTQSVTVPHSFSGDLVHCYIAFESLDGFEQSDSKYAGAVTVA